MQRVEKLAGKVLEQVIQLKVGKRCFKLPGEF